MGSPEISGGYIIISRNIIESEIWDKPPLYVKIWLYLLTRAQHGDYKRLKRGQLVTSIPEIIEACSWRVGFRKEKPTKDQVYQVIEWLRKPHEFGAECNTNPTMITTTKATHGLLINIDNYDFYQTSKNYESNNDSDDDGYMKAIREQRQPDNINKNDKNVKNDNNISRKPKRVYEEDSVEMILTNFFIQEIQKNDSLFTCKKTQNWCEDFRKII